MTTLVEKLIAMGGNRWNKAGFDRIYFNPETILKIQGIEWECYKTGNVRWNSYGSNTQFKKLLNDIAIDKNFYDVQNDKFVGRYIDWVQEKIPADMPAEKPSAKNVMKRAWEIAKQGAAKFGGSSKLYFKMALKQAWAEVKNGK
jgi:hypothetical protein